MATNKKVGGRTCFDDRADQSGAGHTVISTVNVVPGSVFFSDRGFGN
jgi:hypothetical protein